MLAIVYKYYFGEILMKDDLKTKINIGLGQLHASPKIEGVYESLFDILKQNQANNQNVQYLLMFFGAWNDYSKMTITRLMNQSSLNKRERRQLNIVANQTLQQALSIWQYIFKSTFTSSGEITGAFNKQNEKTKKLILDTFYSQLLKDSRNHDFHDFMTKLIGESKPKTSAKKDTKRAAKEVKSVQHRSYKSVEKPVEQVQRELAGDTSPVTTRAESFLDMRNGQSHYDRSFEDVNGKTDGHAWKPEFHVGKPINKAPNKQQIGKVYGYILSDPQYGFMMRLKSYYSQTKVLEPHVLETVFAANGVFSRLSNSSQIEAMYLIAYFAPINDWQTFADVCHGRYLSDLIYRRKRNWQDLATINEKNGLISQFLSGTFPNMLRETAFWFYLARWGYIRANNSNLKDGPYLQADESNYSKEDQRILATIRQTIDQIGGGSNDNTAVNRLLNLERENTERLQKLLSLTISQLGLYMYDQATDASYNSKLVNAKIDAFHNKLNDGKLNSIMRDNAVDLLMHNGPLSQYRVIIQQHLAKMQKQQAEYEQTDRQRKVK